MTTTDTTPSDELLAATLRQALALQDAPPALLHAAIGLWATRSGPAATLAHAVRRLRAVLSFDSAAAAPGLLTTRGAGGGPRHLLFSVEGRDIDLRVLPTQSQSQGQLQGHGQGQGQGSFTLSGQVLGPDDRGRIDVLADGAGTVVGSAELSALGEFSIGDVAPGRYELLMRLGDDEIALPAIDVGGGSS